MDKEKYIKRFKKIYKRKTGKSISGGEALAHFEKLIVHVKAVYQPILKVEINNKEKLEHGHQQ